MAHGERRQNQSHCRKDDPGREGRADDPTGQRVGQGPRRHHHPGPGVDAQRGQFGSGERQQALGLGGFLHRAPEARAEVAARDSADLRRGCGPRPQQPPRCGCFSAQHRPGLHPESAVGRGNRANHRAGSAGFRDPMDLRPFGRRAAGHPLGAGLRGILGGPCRGGPARPRGGARLARGGPFGKRVSRGLRQAFHR